jgi:shikimate kinase
MARHISLIGMMGVGKSSVAPLLARELGWPVIEVDALIEKQAGQSIGDIFLEKGEAHFRRLERELIAALIDEPPSVLSLGGGAFMWEETRRLLLERTLVVYLGATVEVLCQRLQSSGPQLRPLLGAPGIDLPTTVEEILQRRAAHYALAHYRIETDHRTPEEVARAIAKLPEIAAP